MRYCVPLEEVDEWLEGGNLFLFQIIGMDEEVITMHGELDNYWWESIFK